MKNIVCIIISILLPHLPFYSQHAGDLDSTFGVNGIVVTEFEGYDIRVNRDKPDGIKAIFPLADGKILCAGTADNGKLFIAARYNEDGSIDETYGEDGFVIEENLGFVSDAKMTENGSLIIAGYDSANIVLLKLKFDGTIDSTFGEYGKVFTTVTYTSLDTNIQIKSNCIAIQNDNKIVVGITSFHQYSSIYTLKMSAIRYHDNGSIDSSFATDGIFTMQHAYLSEASGVRDIFILPDNSSLLVGDLLFSHAVVKLHENGQIDSTFAVNGIKNIPFAIGPTNTIGSFNNASKIVAGNIVLVGEADMPFPYLTYTRITLAKMKLDGELDSTFGIDGKKILLDLDTVYFDHVHMSIEILDDSKIISSGYKDSFTKNFHIIRYHENGTIDSTFGTNGVVKTFIGNSSQAFCSALQEDGKLLVAGVSDSGAFTIARYHAHSDTPTSILPLEKYNTLLLYPNPVSDILFIDKIQEPILQIEIRNILGREMHLPINNQSIDVSSLPSGLYFIKVKTEKGELFGKFVKE